MADGEDIDVMARGAVEQLRELRRKLEVAEFQVREARDVLAHLEANLRAAGGVFVGPADMADALLTKWAEQGVEAMGFRVSNDLRQSGAEICECGHEAADHEYSFVRDHGYTSWYHPIRCRQCKCTKPTLSKRR